MSLFDSTWAAADATNRTLFGWSSESTLNGAWKDGMWDIQDMPQKVTPVLQRKTRKVEINNGQCFHEKN